MNLEKETVSVCQDMGEAVTLRFTLDLAEPTEESTNEFSYEQLKERGLEELKV